MSVEAVRPSPYPPEFEPRVSIGLVNGKALAVFRHQGVNHQEAVFLTSVGEQLLLSELVAPQPQQNIVPASADVLRQLKG